MAKKAAKKVWFEKCNCGAKVGPHGYFHIETAGQCPWPTMSMEAAEAMLPSLALDYALTADEVVALREEVEDAELPEKMGDEEIAALSAYQAGVEAAKAEAELMSGLTLALVLAAAEDDDENAQVAALILSLLLP